MVKASQGKKKKLMSVSLLRRMLLEKRSERAVLYFRVLQEFILLAV